MTNKTENKYQDHEHEKRKILNARKKILYKTLTIQNYLDAMKEEGQAKEAAVKKFREVFGISRAQELLNNTSNAYELILKFDAYDMIKFMNHF